jgi:HlyD family secretion protein
MRRGVVVGIALAVAVGGGYAAWASATEANASYRTVKVTRGDVEKQLELSGTLTAEGTDQLSFGSSGPVAGVSVPQGSKVKAGQVLATLDRTSLRATVARAQADLAAARAQLEQDEELQDEQASGDDSSSADNPTARASQHSAQGDDQTFVSNEPTSGPDQGTSTPTIDLTQLHQQQVAVTSAQSTASQALAAARDALAHQTEACANAFQDEPTTDPTDEPTTQPTMDPDDQECTEALAAVQDAQQKVANAQQALQDAIDALTKILEAAVAQLEQQSSQSGQQPSDQPSQQPTQQPTAPTQQPSASQGSDGKVSPTVTVTAATLAHDQAAIEQAKADLASANEALAGAVLRAPHAGTVAEVDIAKGDAASAGTTAFVVVSPGLTTLEVTVSDTQLRSLELGQQVTVTPAGATKGYPAEVSYLNPVPDTSSGSATYAVTITLDKEGLSLPNGGAASAAVVVGTAKNVLTVPTSAVSSGSVQVLDGSKVTRTRVTTGIVGTTRTEITEGLKIGDEVVVADLSADLPSGNDQNNRFGGGNGGLGGFGGNGTVGFAPGQGPVVQR